MYTGVVEGAIKVSNPALGREVDLYGSSLRSAVLQAYAEYELGDSESVWEEAYGSLVVEDGPDRARLGGWTALFV